MHNEYIFEVCVYVCVCVCVCVFFFSLLAVLEMSIAFRKEWFMQKIQGPT